MTAAGPPPAGGQGGLGGQPASKGRPPPSGPPGRPAVAASPGCCSFQNSLGPPEYRKWRRLHGLQLPLHPQQVAGWATLAAFGAATFCVLVPALGPELRPSVLPLLAGLFAVHVASHLAAVLLDPADAALRRLGVPRAAVPEFDRTKHAHVIEHGRCHLCNIATSGPRTKHCSVCNKCVGRFDHHCKWLNHCVGGRNYAAFLVCVVSAVLASLVVVAVSVAELVLYHVEPSWLSPWTRTAADGGGVAGVASLVFADSALAFLCVVSGLGVLAAVSAGLLLHLCLFHVYISVLGITTYEYIRRYRSQLAATAPAHAPPPQPPSTLSTLTASNGTLRTPRTPNSGSADADVHSNVGTPLDSSRYSSTPPSDAPLRPPGPSASRPRRPWLCFGNAVTKSGGKAPSRSSTASTAVHDIESGLSGPYTISYPGRAEAGAEARCCAWLRPSPPRRPPDKDAAGMAARGARRLPSTSSRSSTSASAVSDLSSSLGSSLRTGGYQQPEVTEYTGCECNPGRIPIGPPSMAHGPPQALQRRPPLKDKQRTRAAAEGRQRQRALLTRLCSRLTARAPPAPARRAGLAVPYGPVGAVGARRNQVRPSAESPQARLLGAKGPAKAGKAGKPARNGSGHAKAPKSLPGDAQGRRPSASSDRYSPLPALPQPSRRRLQGVSLKELADVVAYAQDPKQGTQQQPPSPQQAQPPQPAPRSRPSPQQVKQQQQLQPPPRRHPSDPVRRAALTRSGRRRSSTPQPARPKSPTLSPIHESGLSNPPTPQRPRTAQCRQTPGQTPDSDPSEPDAGADLDEELDEEHAQSIMYIDEDEGTYFTASMSSMSSVMTPLTPLTPMTPMTPMSAGGFSAASWAATKDGRASASAL